MAIIREYIAPFLAIFIFLIALVAVSARIFLPSDMAAPAPIEEVNPQPEKAQLPAAISFLLPSDS
ncbi:MULTISPECIES: hypothetical protein [Cyanophyceae]|jgi:hypothetical protein|uniref:hypothetical protein n=1 Tax=Cyanophyceae TaxID=3028117 RepID=UPI001683A249|nr:MULTISPECIES: hypothetical protein [unclassified Trichocoleus]MBD1834177.1 hypothetical protein [Cyanobacteria bacterium FACHB-472]MBD1933016.1 hypothetical protein [Trichocoleus sp. FACHB-69]MBD2004256.1 hypothetical protein [Trichocoleus sp. FACHB-40]